MSLQNLLKQNDYDLYCDTMNMTSLDIGTITANNGIFESVSTPELLSDPGTDITIFNNIAPQSDLATSLGLAGKGFRNLFCQNLCGLGGPVNVQTSINGPLVPAPNPSDPPVISNLIITSPVGITGPGVNPVRLNNGLVFGNVGSNNTTLSEYYTVSATPSTQGSVSGPFAVIPIVDWVATRIGNTVSLRFKFNRQSCTSVTATIFINLGAAFTSVFYPSVGVGFSVPVANSNSTAVAALGFINTSGNITIQSITNGNINFGNLELVGLAVPDGTYYQINYNI